MLGIGKPPGQMDPKAFLLQKFNASAQERVRFKIPLISCLAIIHLLFTSCSPKGSGIRPDSALKNYWKI